MSFAEDITIKALEQDPPAEVSRLGIPRADYASRELSAFGVTERS